MSRAHRPHTLRLGFLLSNLRHSLGAALHLHNTGFRRGIHDNVDRRQAAQQTGMMFSLEQETKHARCSMRRADSDTTSTNRLKLPSARARQMPFVVRALGVVGVCYEHLEKRFETGYENMHSESVHTFWLSPFVVSVPACPPPFHLFCRQWACPENDATWAADAESEVMTAGIQPKDPAYCCTKDGCAELSYGHCPLPSWPRRHWINTTLRVRCNP
jgi:hypothetical protein